MPYCRLVAVVLLAVIGLGSSQDAMAESWSPSQLLSTHDYFSTYPDVAMCPNGDAVSVWNAYPRTRKQGTAKGQAATLSNGQWRGPTDLSLPEDWVHRAVVKMDGACNTVVLYKTYLSPTREGIKARYKPAAAEQGWDGPVTLSTQAMDVPGLEKNDLAVAESGEVVAIWLEQIAPGEKVVRVANRRSGPNASWSEPETLAVWRTENEYLLGDVTITVNDDGRAVAVWAEELDGGDWIVRSAHRGPSGDWTGPVTLDEPRDTAWDMQVTLDQQGNAVAAWLCKDFEEKRQLCSAERPSAGSWSTPVRLGEKEVIAGPILAMDGRGGVR